MNLVFQSYRDEDGNFLKDFQSTGFDARTWELSLHAFFNETELDQLGTGGRVDFIVTNGNDVVGVEATTTQPPQGVAKTQPGPGLRGIIPEDIEEGIAEFVHQLGKALRRKVGKRSAGGRAYWETDEIASRPFVLAVQTFHSPSSLFHSFGYAAQYLFGQSPTAEHDTDGTLIVGAEPIAGHEWNGKIIPSGVFDTEEYTPVSAVIFSNSSSVSQFNRIGLQLGLGEPGVRIFRNGTCAKHDPNSSEPEVFTYEVGTPSAPDEEFSQAVHVFHNPNAAVPLPEGFFGRASEHVRLPSGQILTTHHGAFVPYVSVTRVFQST